MNYTRKKLRKDRLDGIQSNSEGTKFTGVIKEGKFHVRERHEKIGQYLIAWEYNLRDIVALPHLPSTPLSDPSEIFSGFQRCGKLLGD